MGTSTRAKRDAELALSDEFDAIAQMITGAKAQAKTATSEVNTWAEGALSDLWANYDREMYDVASAATQANMGTSGFRMAGLNDLNRKKQEGANDVVSTKMQRLMQVSTELDKVLEQARTSSQSLARKKTLLIGQLRDQYAQEERTFQLQKEQNDIAWYNARTSRMGLKGGEKPKEPTAAEILKMPLNERVNLAVRDIEAQRTMADQNGGGFQPSTKWAYLRTQYGPDVMTRPEIWAELYPMNAEYRQNKREDYEREWGKVKTKDGKDAPTPPTLGTTNTNTRTNSLYAGPAGVRMTSDEIRKAAILSPQQRAALYGSTMLGGANATMSPYQRPFDVQNLNPMAWLAAFYNVMTQNEKGITPAEILARMGQRR